MDRYALDVLGVGECRYIGSGRCRLRTKRSYIQGGVMVCIETITPFGDALFCSKKSAAALND